MDCVFLIHPVDFFQKYVHCHVHVKAKHLHLIITMQTLKELTFKSPHMLNKTHRYVAYNNII